MTHYPAPMTSSDCDLRGYDFMPLFGHKLFNSRLYMRGIRNPRAVLAAMKLWWVSWQQCPAASLPDDDEQLCIMADFGMDMNGWMAVREQALHGFVKCQDGRLYHPLLAPEAMSAWERRRKDRQRKAAQRARKNSGHMAEGQSSSSSCHDDVPSPSERCPTGQDEDFLSDRTGQDSIKKTDKSVFRAAPHLALVDNSGFRGTLPPDPALSPQCDRPDRPSGFPECGPRSTMVRHTNRVMDLTGRKRSGAMKLLGKWIKALGNDLAALDDILAAAERMAGDQGLADGVAWIERAVANRTGNPVPERHLSLAEKQANEALARAAREWSAMFAERRDFGWVKKHWPDRARALGLPVCDCTREAYLAYFQQQEAA